MNLATIVCNDIADWLKEAEDDESIQILAVRIINIDGNSAKMLVSLSYYNFIWIFIRGVEYRIYQSSSDCDYMWCPYYPYSPSSSLCANGSLSNPNSIPLIKGILTKALVERNSFKFEKISIV